MISRLPTVPSRAAAPRMVMYGTDMFGRLASNDLVVRVSFVINGISIATRLQPESKHMHDVI